MLETIIMAAVFLAAAAWLWRQIKRSRGCGGCCGGCCRNRNGGCDCRQNGGENCGKNGEN